MKKVILFSLALIALSAIESKAQHGTFKDYRDDQSYEWVKIGWQTWMAENLNYDNGSGTWTNTFDKVLYDFTDYGYFYTWETAKNVCPHGWHLPSAKEWEVLIDHAGGRYLAGKKLKSNKKWDDDGNGTNYYGFSALPGGTKGEGYLVYNRGYWWTSTEYSPGIAFSVSMYDFKDDAALMRGDNSKYYNVRCVKDVN